MGTDIKLGSFPRQYPNATFDTGPAVGHLLQNFQVRYSQEAFYEIKINVPPGQATEKLEPGEILTAITVYFESNVVWSLALLSNKRTYGPYGPQKGISLTLPVEKGKIIGFFGHSPGQNVDGIGIYVAPIV